MVDQSTINSIKNYLLAIHQSGIKVSFGVLYGSQVTGKADKWSDIDLIVVSPLFDKQRTRKDIDTLWITAGHHDNRIEPIPCGEKQWIEDDSSAIIEIARRQGIQIEL